jgi:hypothetical protein
MDGSKWAGTFLVGLDLGQKGDYTAIAVVERRVEALGGIDPVTYEPRTATRLDVRHLERLPLGTSYPDVVAQVCDLVRVPDLRRNCVLVVDATGVGAPVVDLLRRAPLECALLPVMITGGDHQARGVDGWRVPKRDLVTGLQVVLESGELRIPEGLTMARALVTELMSMQVKITWSGHDSYGAFLSGEHDDLVLALGLACWARRFGWVGEVRGRLPIG